MHYRLIGVGNTYTFELSGSGLLSVGRAVTNDCAVVDPTISRKHADLKVTPGGVEVMDAGSSNGTFVNGVQIDKSLLVPGDEVTFGKVVFRLEQVTPARPAPTPAPAGKAGGATIVRQIPKTGEALALGRQGEAQRLGLECGPGGARPAPPRDPPRGLEGVDAVGRPRGAAAEDRRVRLPGAGGRPLRDPAHR
jgi:hypothetical protein